MTKYYMSRDEDLIRKIVFLRRSGVEAKDISESLGISIDSVYKLSRPVLNTKKIICDGCDERVKNFCDRCSGVHIPMNLDGTLDFEKASVLVICGNCCRREFYLAFWGYLKMVQAAATETEGKAGARCRKKKTLQSQTE